MKDKLIKIILVFCEILNDIRYRTYQEPFAMAIIEAVLDGDSTELTALFARQSGKTEVGKSVLLGLAVLLPALAKTSWVKVCPQITKYSDGFWAGMVGPKQAQAQIPFDRIRQTLSQRAVLWLMRLFGASPTICNSQALALSNGSRLIALTANDDTNNEGYTFHVIWFEECQLLSSFQLYKVFHPMCAATAGSFIKVGTPAPGTSPFMRSISYNKRECPQHHFEAPYETVIAEVPEYARFIEQEKRRLSMLGGEEAPEFAMAYRLKWVAASRSFIKPEELKALQGNYPRKARDRQRSLYAGIDVAKINDSTVVTLIEDWGDHKRIIDWLELKGNDYAEQVGIMLNFIRDCQAVAVDSTGVGDPVVDMLRSRFRGRIEGVHFSPKNKDNLYRALLMELKAGRLLYPGDEGGCDVIISRFLRQMSLLEAEYLGGYLSVRHPSGYDEHDDYADSLALALHAASLPAYRYEMIGT